MMLLAPSVVPPAMQQFYPWWNTPGLNSTNYYYHYPSIHSYIRNNTDYNSRKDSKMGRNYF